MRRYLSVVFFNVNRDIKIWRRGRYLSSKSFFRVFSKIRLLRKHHFTFSTRKVSNISRSQNAKTSNIRKLVSVTSCAKNRSIMATAIAFSRQNREFTQRRRRRHLERQKSNRFRLAKQQLCTCITLFCTFLCRRCTTTTWNCLISRFVEDGSKRQQLSFSFPELWRSPLEFNSNQICQHLTH